ncbi:succinate dehydrogenase, cytochrome b556 subunit [Verruconis gallopava]|uniref:Succinate dehydrogenase, cytochrome b556 subunit n=1 Tax=Verruconis gallopava TaxID=253628 RepID=A0A0D1XVM1_9PEZI|nr:succinate dehydrogenase, cytochrome b556 subunit [Verruconis gallopava]KIW06841.1 succinate dehydrogenase, cytochrome b556 subunit [Verruconis gallopava]
MSQQLWQRIAKRSALRPWQSNQVLHGPNRESFIVKRVLSSSSSQKGGYAADAGQTLVQQRLRRPVSPHLSIYGFQVNYIGSGLNRITGVLLSGGFYLTFMGYALGMPLSSSAMAASVAAWPVAAKVLTKVLIAFPFTYHSLAGVRHLYLDFALGFANKQYIKSMWAVFAVSGLSALYFAFGY